MTQLAILSDIHGNLPALEAVLADMNAYELDGIVVAGDLVGGPQSMETIRRLRDLGCWLIRGNSEGYALSFYEGDGPDYWRTSRQWASMRWSTRQLDHETLIFLRSLPEQLVIRLPGTTPIRVVHGSPRNPSELLFPDRDPGSLEKALAAIAEQVLVCGHSHRPWSVQQNGQLALNPGAVCAPLNGKIGAQYALLTWQGASWRVSHQMVDYDLELVRRAYRNSGLLTAGGALARSFLLTIETGRDVASDFLSYAYQLAAEAGYPGCQVVPNGIWEQAAVTYRWNRERIEQDLQD